jgi:DNA-binding MarR family transcriptional regulator
LPGPEAAAGGPSRAAGAIDLTAQDASPALELALAKISASALAELLELTARMLHSRGYAEDLFPAQWAALRYFARSPAERRTASELARFQGLANGPVSRTVRTLVQKGLLAKAEAQPRGRAEILELTAAGVKLMRSDPTIELEAILARLDASDQEAFARGLETVLRRLSMSAS